MSNQRKTYSETEQAKILEKVFELLPDMSVNKACEQVGIAHSIVNRWVNKSPEIKERYGSARYDFQEKLASDILDIADEKIDNTLGKDRSSAVQEKRVRIDARKWLLSKLAPKRYGERLAIAGDDDNPLVVGTIKRIVVDGKTKDD